jgi:anaerobic magnesium-protoporphyrin IX monomethyl ester cyclase
MKIVLVRPNYKSHIITPPLGIGYLAAYLKKNGIAVKMIDGLRNELTQEQILTEVQKEKPDAVGITCLTAFYNEVIALAKALKHNNFRTIIGGVHPTFLPHSTLIDSQADFVICGEGEVALTKLIKNNFDNHGIRGVYSIKDLKSDEDLIERTETIQELDAVPFPDWEQMNPSLYSQAPHGGITKNFPIGVITTTRGCSDSCIFCASPKLYNRKIRYRSPENVVKEITYLVDNYGVKEIHFEDDNLVFEREHIEKICSLIIQAGLRISWACPNGIRADKIDVNLIRLMVKSGCYSFAYGIESADPQILKNGKKNLSI